MQLDYFFSYAEANVVCIIILGILLWHGRTHGTRTEKQIRYDRTIIAHILYFVSDIGWAAVIGGHIPRTRFTVVLFNLLNLILLGLLAYEWFMYMAVSVRLEFRNRRTAPLLCLIPIVLSVAFVVISYIIKPDIWVNAQEEPTPWYHPMMVAAPLVYLISAFICSMNRARKAESKDDAQFYRLVGIYPMGVLASGLIQAFTMNAPLFCFGCVIMMMFFYIQNMQTMVSVDSLTRLNNRGQISRYMRQNRFRENVKAYSLMLDVDNFKHINDTYGHAEGDRALILVSEVLKQTVERVRSAVFIGRYGGDEFTIFFQCGEGDTTPEEAMETVRAALQEKHRENNLPYPLNVSYGYDALRDRNDTLEESLKRADHNLYKNKKAAHIGR